MAVSKFSTIVLFALLSVLVLASNTEAFVPSNSVSSRTTFSSTTPVDISSTQLSERQWNFNEGQSPWGMKQNAEVWNGRVAQVRYPIDGQFFAHQEKRNRFVAIFVVCSDLLYYFVSILQ